MSLDTVSLPKAGAPTGKEILTISRGSNEFQITLGELLTFIQAGLSAVGSSPLPVLDSGVLDSSGGYVHPSNFAHNYGYSGGLLITDIFTDGTNTWTKTFGNDGTNITSESKWIKS